MKFIVIVPSYMKSLQDARWLLGRTLRAARAREPNCALAVIDDGSPRSPRKNQIYMDLQKETLCTVNYREHNLGYAQTVNYGLEKCILAGYDIAITLNSDCEMTTPFIEKLRDLFFADPLLAVVGCKLLFPSGQTQHAGFEINEEGSVTMYDRDTFETLNPGRSDEARYMMGVTGAFQAIRLSALKDIGLYSTNYFLAYEDVEFCLRTWSRGYKIWYEPSIRGVHFEGATRGKGLTENELKSEEQISKDLENMDLRRIRHRINLANGETSEN